VDQLWLWLLEDGITTLLMLESQRRVADEFETHQCRFDHHLLPIPT